MNSWVSGCFAAPTTMRTAWPKVSADIGRPIVTDAGLIGLLLRAREARLAKGAADHRLSRPPRHPQRTARRRPPRPNASIPRPVCSRLGGAHDWAPERACPGGTIG